MEGDTASAGGVGGGAEEEPWKSLRISIFMGLVGCEVVEVAGIAVPFGGGFEEGLEPDEIDGLPFT